LIPECTGVISVENILYSQLESYVYYYFQKRQSQEFYAFVKYLCFTLSACLSASSQHVFLNPLYSRCLLLPELSCQPHYLQLTVLTRLSSILEHHLSILQIGILPGSPTRATCPEEHLLDRMPPRSDQRCRSPVPLSVIHLQLAPLHSPLH
jgi:hypothetical protein